jgi:hypothetical protein
MEPTSQDEKIDKLQPHMQLLSKEVVKLQEYAKAMKMIAVLLIHKQGGCCEIAQSELLALKGENYKLSSYINKETDNLVLAIKEEKDG